MEVYPRCLAPPFSRCVASAWVVSHEMVVVDRLDSRCQCVPYLWVNVALDVTTHNPDDVFLVLVSVGKELAVSLRLLGIYVSILNLGAPYRHQSNVYSVFLCRVDDVVEVIPVRVNTVRVSLRHIPSGRVRLLSIDIVSRYTVEYLHLNDIVTGVAAFL